jgi:hypothetical protein
MGLLSRASGSAASEPVLSKAVLPESEHASSGEVKNAVEEKIRQFHEAHRRFGCALIKKLPSGEEDDDFSRQISEMIGSIGLVIPLGLNYPLILFPPSVDWELITHRLSKFFECASPEGKRGELISFEANSPEDVLKYIKSR